MFCRSVSRLKRVFSRWCVYVVSRHPKIVQSCMVIVRIQGHCELRNTHFSLSGCRWRRGKSPELVEGHIWNENKGFSCFFFTNSSKNRTIWRGPKKTHPKIIQEVSLSICFNAKTNGWGTPMFESPRRQFLVYCLCRRRIRFQFPLRGAGKPPTRRVHLHCGSMGHCFLNVFFVICGNWSPTSQFHKLISNRSMKQTQRSTTVSKRILRVLM